MTINLFLVNFSPRKVCQERPKLLLPSAVRVRQRVLHVPKALLALPLVKGRVQEVPSKDGSECRYGGWNRPRAPPPQALQADLPRSAQG